MGRIWGNVRKFYGCKDEFLPAVPQSTIRYWNKQSMTEIAPGEKIEEKNRIITCYPSLLVHADHGLQDSRPGTKHRLGSKKGQLGTIYKVS